MKSTVIFHRADYDGIFCREIARKFLPPDTEFIGWDYGDPRIPLWDGWREAPLYVLDLSPDCLADLWSQDQSKIIWIDHHKSAIEKFSADIPGYRIDGVAACRLAWQWFIFTRNVALPEKRLFVERHVSEPLAVRLAGEYDVWDHRDNDADVAFQFGLDSQRELDWKKLLYDGDGEHKSDSAAQYVTNLIDDGCAAMQCYAKRDADVMRTRSFLMDFEGLKFLALNTARCNSNTFNARDIPATGHDALLAFYWTGEKWSVSMYHAAHRKDLDLSKIAVKYGGGGHRGACGFTAAKLPWIS